MRTMAPDSPWAAVACLVLACATAWLLARRFGPPSTGGRVVPIDGLRGFLAFFVFLHHACIWYHYARTGQWEVPDSNLYTHFGRSSVALFFMITGFLFFTKLIAGRTRPLDWGRLYISRVLRLVPLYCVVLCFLFAIVTILSAGTVRVPAVRLTGQVIKWMTFTILGAPNINGVGETTAIVAGVTWTLAYEWFFYLCLPALALLIRIRPPALYVILGLVSPVCFAVWLPELHHLLPFLGGIAAAVLNRIEGVRRFCTRPWSALIPLSSLFIVVRFFHSSYEVLPLLLLTLAFVVIACGNGLFGLLTHPVSLTLGAMAYSVYLLHGMALFMVFYFALGLSHAAQLGAFEHWLVIAGLTPVLVAVCFVSYRLIEQPAMGAADTALAWLKSRGGDQRERN